VRFDRRHSLVFGGGDAWNGFSAEQPAPRFRVLMFSKTASYRHDSISAGIAAIEELGGANGFSVDGTEDASRFSDAGLTGYRVVVFLNTTGDVLEQARRRRWSATSGRAAALSESIRRATPNMAGRSRAGSSAPISRATQISSRRRSGSSMASIHRPRTCRQHGSVVTSGTIFALVRAAVVTSWRRSTRPAMRAARWAAITRSPAANGSRAGGVGTRRWVIPLRAMPSRCFGNACSAAAKALRQTISAVPWEKNSAAALALDRRAASGSANPWLRPDGWGPQYGAGATC